MASELAAASKLAAETEGERRRRKLRRMMEAEMCRLDMPLDPGWSPAVL